jgi:hypothetical protein
LLLGDLETKRECVMRNVIGLMAALSLLPAFAVAADAYKYAGLPLEKAAAAMTVPEGFDVQLFAGEPDVCQPIALCLDEGHCHVR